MIIQQDRNFVSILIGKNNTKENSIMKNRRILSSIAAGSLVFSTVAWSDATDSAATSTTITEMSKDVWLEKLKGVVPALICKGFTQDETVSKQLAKVNIDYEKCTTLIPSSFEKCQTDLYSSIPDKIDSEAAGKWGHSLGECIGKDFAIKYLL